MIQPSVPHWQGDNWKNSLATAIRDPAELLELLELPRHWLPAAINASQQFPLRVPHGFVARMKKGVPDDPLLLQVLPLHLELEAQSGFVADPVGDLQAMKTPGLLQKYAGRVLLITTGACGIHCRYCFRRHFPYSEAHIDQTTWQRMIEVISADTSIHEVILSGGDPLSLSDERLLDLIRQLERIPHLTRLRVHTRLPVVVPERVTEGLLQGLSQSPLQLVMVIHVNHANELDDSASKALQSLRNCGITMLNQTVLLRKINDNKDALTGLSEALFAAGVLPYYLHQLDQVQGAGHFNVSDQEALELLGHCRAQLPGYLVPKLVREVQGSPYKLPLE